MNGNVGMTYGLYDVVGGASTRLTADLLDRIFGHLVLLHSTSQHLLAASWTYPTAQVVHYYS